MYQIFWWSIFLVPYGTLDHLIWFVLVLLQTDLPGCGLASWNGPLWSDLQLGELKRVYRKISFLLPTLFLHSRLNRVSYLWYKHWKVCRGCLEKFVLGNSRESSDFPEGHRPEGKTDDPREVLWASYSDNLWGLSTIFQTFRLKQWKLWRQT